MASQSARIGLTPGISAEDLHRVIDGIINGHGCRTCGLVGFDLQLLGPDPIEERFAEIADIPGVSSVTLTRA